MSSKDDERVLCVPRTAVQELLDSLPESGFVAAEPRKLGEILAPNASFIRRGDCEQDPSFKQIIPYIALTGFVNREPHIFVYNRTKKSGEERLIDKASVGVGGHCNMADGDNPFDAYHAAILRELQEELHLSDKYFNPKMLGFINDESTDVNAVHLGVLLEFSPDNTAEVTTKCESLEKARWEPLYNLQTPEVEFERWSQIAVSVIPALRAASARL